MQADLTRRLQAFGGEDGLDHVDAFVDIDINDDVIIFRIVAHFRTRFCHAFPYDLFTILGAGIEPAFQFGHARRQNEHADQILRRIFGQLLGALPVDIEHHIAAL